MRLALVAVGIARAGGGGTCVGWLGSGCWLPYGGRAVLPDWEWLRRLTRRWWGWLNEGDPARPTAAVIAAATAITATTAAAAAAAAATREDVGREDEKHQRSAEGQFRRVRFMMRSSMREDWCSKTSRGLTCRPRVACARW